MNATLLKRLFKAVNEGSIESLTKLALTIVDDERGKGHVALARQLDDILRTPRMLKELPKDEQKSMRALPLSRRYQEPLTSPFSSENLRHHMVLPPHVEARFRRIEKEYAADDRLALYGLTPIKRVLLYGPPGCGKSLGAERLAWSTGLPLVKVRFDSIMSSYFGESASNLREVFESTKDRPTLLFLDECDFVARSRTERNDVGEAPRIVNTLLQLLDEYRSPGLIVAATNLNDTLDKAIFRRFDDVFEVPIPGPNEIDELLRVTLSAIMTEPDIQWDALVNKLNGSSAATVVKVAENAAKAAVMSSEMPVRQEHIEGAIADAFTT